MARILLVVAQNGSNGPISRVGTPEIPPIWGLGTPKMDHFETTFGPFLVREGSDLGDPNNGEMRDFGLFRTPGLGRPRDQEPPKKGRALGVGVRSSTTIYLRARA